MVNTVQPSTVGREQRPQTLLPEVSNDKRREEEDLSSEAYYNEDDEGTDDTSMLVEAHTPDLRAIMVSIKALAPTVSSLQLASGIQHTERRIKGRARPRQSPDIQAPEASPRGRPTPEDVGTQPHPSALNTLAALGDLGKESPGLRAFPVIFTLLENNQCTSPR